MTPFGLVCSAADETGGWSHPRANRATTRRDHQRQITSYADLHMSSYADNVRSILAAGAGTPQPTTAGDALVLELPRVPTRPLSDYAIGRPVAGAPAVGSPS